MKIKEIDKTRRAWYDMVMRCTSKKSPNYRYYGGRGISVCDRWLNYENFLYDMGNPKDGQSLDRIDNTKGYSKDNCRWASRSQQMRNCRANKRIAQYSIDGKLLNTFNSVVEASEKTKTNYTSILHMINKTGNKRKMAGGFIWKKAN